MDETDYQLDEFETGEPYFVLRGRDIAAGDTLRYYAMEYLTHGGDPRLAKALRMHAASMDATPNRQMIHLIGEGVDHAETEEMGHEAEVRPGSERYRAGDGEHDRTGERVPPPPSELCGCDGSGNADVGPSQSDHSKDQRGDLDHAVA